VPDEVTHLLIGSVEAHSGKSAVVLGLASQLQGKGLNIGYGKPLGSRWGKASTLPPSVGLPDLARESIGRIDEDTYFLASAMQLKASQLCPTLVLLDSDAQQQRLCGQGTEDYSQSLHQYLTPQNSDLVLIEGPATLEEGRLFGLSLLEISQTLQAGVLLVVRWAQSRSIDAILGAQYVLGDSLLGVILNDVPTQDLKAVQSWVQEGLETRGIPILGVLPHSELLRSVSVGELVERLDAKILAAADRLDLMVESLCIGAMNVNSALEYFRKGHNMAVVTGGDRTDLQLAALETSTQCLVLTGHIPPSPTIIARAEEMEVPILSVNLDTLTTVEIIEQAFAEVSFHETAKAQCMAQMSQEHLDVERLLKLVRSHHRESRP
jgi:uncharacterized protein